MRIFVVVGHLATTSPDFSLEDIPGTSGRLDILCRCINSAFVLSHGIRRDVQVYLVLCGGPAQKIICLQGDRLRHLNPDERTTAALLKKALALEADRKFVRSTPGIFVRQGDLAGLLAALREEHPKLPLYYLKEEGADQRQAGIEEGIYVLGDHQGMTEEEEALLEGCKSQLISIGPLSLHADHCIILINNELDRMSVETGKQEP
ncbi:MAG: tRNA (pseudouridine(54)-N(1))-methyltransferase TrmY [Methanosarcinales archaeon]|nr:tRNA (pseudouridine(54)-N(1))-methyltransferase TrmY [Methanosarcinales archaeon]